MTKGPFDGRSPLDIDTHRQAGADLPPPVPPGTALHAWRRTGVEAKPTQAESQRGLTLKKGSGKAGALARPLARMARGAAIYDLPCVSGVLPTRP
ncbi:hypothetical protein AB0179_27470, partial [Klebsiella pneumoniae]